MSNEKKSLPLINQIIESDNREKAIITLNAVLEALHLSQNYTNMVGASDALKTYGAKLKQIEDKVDDSVKTHEELNKIRFELDVLYREVNDSLTHKISAAKIYYDEIKSTRRFEALRNLKESEQAKEFKAKSTSALETIIGGDDNYTKLASEKSISYANYKELEGLLKSIERLGNTIASREKRELIILSRDVK